MNLRPLHLSAASAAAALVLAATLAAPLGARQGLADPGSAFKGVDPRQNWSAAVERTERGHLIGNPKAETRLIEFVSYTCGHCANFAMQGEPAMDMTLLLPGKMAVEVRPVIRNALDLTISLLVQCGDPAGFKERHRAFMYGQREWMARAQAAPQSQQQIWTRADKTSRMNAASALGWTNMMVQRGHSITEVNACIMNDAAAKQLIANGEADYTQFGVNATPSFALDNKLLAQVHSWDALYPLLAARFSTSPDGQPATR